jgi:hypothetical protein
MDEGGATMLISTLVALVLTGALALPVWAQTAPVPPVSPSAPAAGGSASALSVIAVIAVLLLALAVTVKLFDLRRKRESEAVQLQAQVSDALLRDPALFNLPITPTAQVPFWSGSPATIEIAGQVPDPETRARVIRMATQEAERIRPDVKIEDRLAVVATMVRAA